MKITSRLRSDLKDDSMLTRYVDIHSFLYFITQSKLRFARLDTFEDLNEGFSVYTAEGVKTVAENSRSIKNITGKEEMLQQVSRLKEQHRDLADEYRKHQQSMFACCWYMGNKESVAMWNLYSNSDSVAIRFNAKLLVQIICGIASKDDRHFSAMQYGSVEYADLSCIKNPQDMNSTGFLKDDSFSHEQEFRFLVEKNANDDTLEYELCLGDLKKIDFTIITHPKMEEWKIRNILNVLSCYDLPEKFQPSELTLKNNF